MRMVSHGLSHNLVVSRGVVFHGYILMRGVFHEGALRKVVCDESGLLRWKSGRGGGAGLVRVVSRWDCLW